MKYLLPCAALLLASISSIQATEPGSKVQALARRIDAEIDRRLAEVKVAPAARSDDAEFLRRVTLDITGRLPTAEQAVEFLDSTDPDKRGKLIDALLARPEFGQNFARYWTELFIKRDPEVNGNLKTAEFRAWMADEFNRGSGWDQIVTKMLTVDDVSPSTLYLRANRLNGERPSPAKVVGTTSALFMGIQYQCAECHNHPYTKEWTHEGFWGMAAFFGRTYFETTASKNRDIKVTEEDQPPPPADAKNNRKVLKLPVGGVIDIPDPLDAKKTRGTVSAKLMDGREPELKEKGPHRPIFASWVTGTSNPYFARAMANRLWGYFFSKGLVDPLDDMNPKNEPSHPALLALLADEVQASGHDYRHLIRAICNSETYQRTSKRTVNDPDDDHFGRRTVQFIHGEVLLTCLDQVLGVEPPAPPKRGRNDTAAPPSTASLFDSGVYDDNPSNYSFGAPQLLRLMNTDVPRRAPDAIARLLAKTSEPAQAIERLYLMALSRRPGPEELQLMQEHLRAAETPAKGYEGVLWVLINSAEFVSNH